MEIAILFSGISLSIVIYFALNEIKDRLPYTPDLSSIKYQLEEIVEKLNLIAISLGGDKKLIEKNKKEREELKEKVIKLLLQSKATKENARKQADKLFEEAEFEEEHGGFSNLDSIKRWVIEAEVEERNKREYCTLLGKARNYIKTKEKIFPHGRDRQDMADRIGTDYKGAGWLIKKLQEEGLLKKVEKYNSETETMETEYCEVIKT